MIVEAPAAPILLKPPVMVCDKPISTKIPEPLPRTAHYLVSCGPPRSGKTSALLAMLSQTRPALYRQCFNNVMVIMPKSSRKSMQSDPFEDLDESKVFDDLTLSSLEKVHEIAEKAMHEGEHSLLYIDDMAANLKDAVLLKQFNKLINNRRHLRLSIWCIAQTYKSIPLSNRKTITHMLFFKPNNRQEGTSVIKELVTIPEIEWEAYTRHAFGQGIPHAFLFLDVDKQAVYDKDFNRLRHPDAYSEQPISVAQVPQQSSGKQAAAAPGAFARPP